jgi:hypothetical protein
VTARPKKKAPAEEAPEPVVPEPAPPEPVVSDADRVRDISEAVYRHRLGDGGKRMVELDGDDGTKLRARAIVYDSLTRSYLKVFKEIGRA